MHLFPAKTEPVEHAGTEVLHDNIAGLDQVREDGLTVGILEIHRNRALVAVQHREVEAVCVGEIPELLASCIASRRLEFDDVRAEKAHQLARRRTGLDMGHVENANTG